MYLKSSNIAYRFAAAVVHTSEPPISHSKFNAIQLAPVSSFSTEPMLW